MALVARQIFLLATIRRSQDLSTRAGLVLQHAALQQHRGRFSDLLCLPCACRASGRQGDHHVLKLDTVASLASATGGFSQCRTSQLDQEGYKRRVFVLSSSYFFNDIPALYSSRLFLSVPARIKLCTIL